MPAVVDDPELRRRLARVYADCQNSYAETARALGLSKHLVRRLLLQRHGPITKTRARLELALIAYESTQMGVKRSRSASESYQTEVPELAEEVLRYVLQAVEAKRGEGHRL